MGRIDLRKFDDIRHLVRARLLSSEFHDRHLMTFSLNLLTVRYMSLRQGRNLGLSRRQDIEKAL